MTDEVTKPQGQALVNSHTFWGAVLMAASGSGLTTSIAPFAAKILEAYGIANPASTVNAIGLIGGLIWNLYGRANATAPITGILKK